MEPVYTFSLIASIVTFSLTSTLTPGPNNIMLLSSGLTFGYKRTLPHMMGIIIGFPIMIMCIGLGMGIVFKQFPSLLHILKILGALYLFWMAYKIATNVSEYKTNTVDGEPFSFFQAVLFQWVNMKGWIVAITSISIFVTSVDQASFQVFIIAFIYLLGAVIATNLWVFGGVILKKVLKDQKYISIFNKLMALLLIVSIIPFVIE